MEAMRKNESFMDINTAANGINNFEGHAKFLSTQITGSNGIDWKPKRKTRKVFPKIRLRARWHTYLCLKRRPTHINMRLAPKGADHSPPRDL